MKTYKTMKFKSREEWLKHRGIGGSSAGAVLGVSKRNGPIDVWYHFKTQGLDAKNDTQTDSQLYGTEVEELIRQIVKLNLKNYGIKVLEPVPNTMYVDKVYPYLTATIDGSLIVEDESKNLWGLKGKKGILEIKSHIVKNREDLEEWEGRLPQNYLSQVLHYLMVLNDYDFAVLVAKLQYFDYAKTPAPLEKEEIRYYRIQREEFKDTINNIKLKEIAFYERYIKGDEIPAF